MITRTYHLHTEDRPNLPEIIARHFPAFTLTHATGYWQGTHEPAAVIEIATDSPPLVWQLAHDIRATNQQEAVMVEAMRTDTTTITAESDQGSAPLVYPHSPIAFAFTPAGTSITPARVAPGGCA